MSLCAVVGPCTRKKELSAAQKEDVVSSKQSVTSKEREELQEAAPAA